MLNIFHILNQLYFELSIHERILKKIKMHYLFLFIIIIFHNISFYRIFFVQINAALVSIRGSKTFKKKYLQSQIFKV